MGQRRNPSYLVAARAGADADFPSHHEGGERGRQILENALGIHSVLANSDDALSGAYAVKHPTGRADEYTVTGLISCFSAMW